MQHRFTCFYAKADERLDAWPPPAPNMVHGCFFTLRPFRCSNFLFGKVYVFIHQCRAIESGTCRADGRKGLHVVTGSPNIISAGPLIGQSQQFLASDMGISCLLKERGEGFVRTCHELRIHTFCLFARNISRLWKGPWTHLPYGTVLVASDQNQSSIDRSCGIHNKRHGRYRS